MKIFGPNMGPRSEDLWLFDRPLLISMHCRDDRVKYMMPWLPSSRKATKSLEQPTSCLKLALQVFLQDSCDDAPSHWGCAPHIVPTNLSLALLQTPHGWLGCSQISDLSCHPSNPLFKKSELTFAAFEPKPLKQVPFRHCLWMAAGSCWSLWTGS